MDGIGPARKAVTPLKRPARKKTPEHPVYDLRLYVAGQTPRSLHPVRKIIWDLSNAEKVLIGLDIRQ